MKCGYRSLFSVATSLVLVWVAVVVIAAQQAPLKLGDQQSPCVRFQVPEILPQTLHEQPVGHPATHFSHTRKKFDSARALRTR